MPTESAKDGADARATAVTRVSVAIAIGGLRPGMMIPMPLLLSEYRPSDLVHAIDAPPHDKYAGEYGQGYTCGFVLGNFALMVNWTKGGIVMDGEPVDVTSAVRITSAPSRSSWGGAVGVDTGALWAMAPKEATDAHFFWRPLSMKEKAAGKGDQQVRSNQDAKAKAEAQAEAEKKAAEKDPSSDGGKDTGGDSVGDKAKKAKEKAAADAKAAADKKAAEQKAREAEQRKNGERAGEEAGDKKRMATNDKPVDAGPDVKR